MNSTDYEIIVNCWRTIVRLFIPTLSHIKVLILQHFNIVKCWEFSKKIKNFFKKTIDKL
jgi:hypothetical protein